MVLSSQSSKAIANRAISDGQTLHVVIDAHGCVGGERSHCCRASQYLHSLWLYFPDHRLHASVPNVAYDGIVSRDRLILTFNASGLRCDIAVENVCVEMVVAKEESLRLEGLIDEILPDGRFGVVLDNGHRLIAYTAGKMRKYRIRSIVGDRVHVEMTPYDLSKGRIVFRERTVGFGPAGRKFK